MNPLVGLLSKYADDLPFSDYSSKGLDLPYMGQYRGGPSADEMTELFGDGPEAPPERSPWPLDRIDNATAVRGLSNQRVDRLKRAGPDTAYPITELLNQPDQYNTLPPVQREGEDVYRKLRDIYKRHPYDAVSTFIEKLHGRHIRASALASAMGQGYRVPPSTGEGTPQYWGKERPLWDNLIGPYSLGDFKARQSWNNRGWSFNDQVTPPGLYPAEGAKTKPGEGSNYVNYPLDEKVENMVNAPIVTFMHEAGGHGRQNALRSDEWTNSNNTLPQIWHSLVEAGPSLSDLAHMAGAFRLTTGPQRGAPLRHMVKFGPHGGDVDADWMYQQAKKHGLYGGEHRKTMDKLLSENPQFLDMLLRSYQSPPQPPSPPLPLHSPPPPPPQSGRLPSFGGDRFFGRGYKR